MADGYRILVKDGKWVVPAEERPANWRSILDEIVEAHKAPTPEPSPSPAELSNVSDFSSSNEEPKREVPPPDSPHPAVRGPKKLTRHERIRQSGAWKEICESVMASGKAFDAKPDLMTAALVLVAGMFTRDDCVIARLIDAPRPIVSRIAARYVDQNIWCESSHSVYMGEFNSKIPDLEFWMIAMVGNGDIISPRRGYYQSKQNEIDAEVRIESARST